ncbi:hypothetical protein PHMEG_00026078 [Phytophthora megakarya]|uniref:Uncharacterized protein n=1 Tax=Phytophthora megakarya TaxID=4795 RepID=A0A225VD03_9STRA|nr:hypothetical protein PHMEG_00026078 [Phytophthora megakarya]
MNVKRIHDVKSEDGWRMHGKPKLYDNDDKLIQRLLAAGAHQGMPVEELHGLVVVHTPRGRRVVLPPELWAPVFKESHDSIWAGNLRATQDHCQRVTVVIDK